jgi:competence protein ComEC
MTLERRGNYNLLIFAVILILLNAFLIYTDLKNSNKVLTFTMLDVGQGDALFIESPSGVQVLFDSGPPHKILGALAKVMPPFDKSIDAVVITNPDADHIGGLVDVLKNYEVGVVLEPGTFNNSKTYENLKNEIKDQGVKNILAKKGTRMDLGRGAVIDILFPNQDVSGWDPNDGSVVAKLTYGENTIMLTGDSTAKTEKIILNTFTQSALDSDILKVGHHGSHTSTSRDFADAVSPEFALISLGSDNKYGHPRKETLDTLNSLGAKIFRTDLFGTIILSCDRIGPCAIKTSKSL